MTFKILALVLISIGLLDLFVRSLWRNYKMRNVPPKLRGKEAVRGRLQRIKKSAPAYILVLLGAFMLMAAR